MLGPVVPAVDGRLFNRGAVQARRPSHDSWAEDRGTLHTGIESHPGLTHYGLYETEVAREEAPRTLEGLRMAHAARTLQAAQDACEPNDKSYSAVTSTSVVTAVSVEIGV